MKNILKPPPVQCATNTQDVAPKEEVFTKHLSRVMKKAEIEHGLHRTPFVEDFKDLTSDFAFVLF